MAELQQRQGIALLVTLAVAGAGWWWYAQRAAVPAAPLAAATLPGDTRPAALAGDSAAVMILLEGEVARPGRYAVPAGATLAAALAAAGGATAAARLTDIDLHKILLSDTAVYIPPQLTARRFTAGSPLTDRDLIHIPRRGAAGAATAATAAASSGSAGSAAVETIVNLNTATREQLLTLPRIGPKTAEAILEYRAKVGAFRTIDELRNIPRIGDKTIAALRDRVTL